MTDAKLLARYLLAECLGTFMLVFAGTGAIIVNDVTSGVIGHLGVALVFGLVVLTIIYSYGETSGAHVNPAVTLAFWFARRLPGRWVAPYIISQCLGAVLASALLYGFFPAHETLGVTMPSIKWWQAFVFEFLLTWWLMTVILGVSEGAREKGVVAGIVVASAVALEAAFAGPVTGASMNPARSLGPAVVSGRVSDLWIYLLATPLGAMFAVVLCRVTKGPACCSDDLV
ncbi:MAG: aquaporin [Gammaproteobacteria bacterium]|jgi:aquaporin Z